MAIRNLITDHGAVGDGVTDDSGAVDSWLAWAAGQPSGQTLWLPSGKTFHFASTNTLTNGLRDATVIGTGATVDSLYIGNKNVLLNDSAHHALIQTTTRCDRFVDLVSASDVSKASVGKWILICGLNVQGGDEAGFPPNWHFFEFRQITSIGGSALNFDDPLLNAYRSSWPVVGDPSGQGGPASIYFLDDRFGSTQSYLGLTVSAGPVFMVGGQSMIIDGMTFQGAGIAPSLGKLIQIRNTNVGTDAEFDKLVSRLELENCTGSQIQVQSSSIDRLIISGGTNIATMLGAGRNTEINSSTIGALKLGPTSFGTGKSFSASGSAITSVSSSDIALDPTLVSFSAGVFSIAKTDTANIDRLFAWAVPGHVYYFAFYDGAIHTTDDIGHVTSFLITDVYETATHFHALTDIGNVLPTPTFLGGQAANQYVAYPARKITKSGGSGANITTFAPPSSYDEPDEQSCSIQTAVADFVALHSDHAPVKHYAKLNKVEELVRRVAPEQTPEPTILPRDFFEKPKKMKRRFTIADGFSDA